MKEKIITKTKKELESSKKLAEFLLTFNFNAHRTSGASDDFDGAV